MVLRIDLEINIQILSNNFFKSKTNYDYHNSVICLKKASVSVNISENHDPGICQKLDFEYAFTSKTSFEPSDFSVFQTGHQLH